MRRATDRLELAWLATVRWTTIAASAVALAFGRSALDIQAPLAGVGVALVLAVISNVRLSIDARRAERIPRWVPGLLVCFDVTLLTACLVKSGGVLNPVSIVFLVEIVLAALVLGGPWTWAVTALSVAGYGVQMLAPTSELAAAQMMHPQIGEHVRGMWWAFAFTALIIGALVARLAAAIERRDRALAALHDDAARRARLVSLASMAAGAAHELSTPLGTIAVAAGELSRAAAGLPGGQALEGDLSLIRGELARARRILTDLSGRADEGVRPEATTVAAVIDRVLDSWRVDERARVAVEGNASLPVVWPVALAARALGNVIGNALLADPSAPVRVLVAPAAGDRVTIAVIDRGAGMDAETAARAGEPFFTTRPDARGMGLGLFVARATAEQMGGALTIASREGAGTTVTFDLPQRPDVGARA